MTARCESKFTNRTRITEIEGKCTWFTDRSMDGPCKIGQCQVLTTQLLANLLNFVRATTPLCNKPAMGGGVSGLCAQELGHVNWRREKSPAHFQEPMKAFTCFIYLYITYITLYNYKLLFPGALPLAVGRGRRILWLEMFGGCRPCFNGIVDAVAPPKKRDYKRDYETSTAVKHNILTWVLSTNEGDLIQTW